MWCREEIYANFGRNVDDLNMSEGEFDRNNPNFARTLEQGRQRRDGNFLGRQHDNWANFG